MVTVLFMLIVSVLALIPETSTMTILGGVSRKGGGVFEVSSGLTKVQIHLEICYKYSKLHCIHARGF